MPETLDIDTLVLARLAVKLTDHTERRGPDECWPWTGYTQRNGYGWVNTAGVKIAAHRLALILSGVQIPRGWDACHTCDHRWCVNPAHSYPGTRRRNMADCSSRQRHNKPRGENHWRARLTAGHVREIRRRRSDGETTVSLARRFGVNSATISRIARGIWRAEVESC